MAQEEHNNGLDKDNSIPPDVRMKENLPNEEGEVTEGESTAFGISRFLERVEYPAAKEDIIDYAIDMGVEDVVLDMLEQLPDTTYNSPADVSQSLGENSEV
jgi:hypothetical protein